MSERRYTESQMREAIAQGHYRSLRSPDEIDAYLSTLTPDPEPSGEVVELLLVAKKLVTKDQWPTATEVVRAQALLTAEVAQQVEERTKGYREALEKIIRYDEKILTQYVGEYAVKIARQALANKGGSDE